MGDRVIKGHTHAILGLAGAVCVWLWSYGLRGWGVDNRALSVVWLDVIRAVGF